MVVIDVSKEKEKKTTILINPEITFYSKKNLFTKRVAYLYQATMQKLKGQQNVILIMLTIMGKKKI